MIETQAPLALFVYNRGDHTQSVLDRLCQNLLIEKTPLFIFSDAPKGPKDSPQVERVRGILRKYNHLGELRIVEREENYGLSRSIITGVTELLNRYGKVIVLEDDLVTSPYFLKFMNGALNHYENDQRIMSVSGFNFPTSKKVPPEYYPHDVYLSRRNTSWGWATWKDRWEKVDWEISDYDDFLRDKKAQMSFDLGGSDLTKMLIAQMEGRIDSWAIRFAYAHFRQGGYSLVPTRSYIYNIGHDGSGTHCKAGTGYEDETNVSKKHVTFPGKLEPDDIVLDAYRKVYLPGLKGHVKSIIKKIIFYDALRKILN